MKKIIFQRNLRNTLPKRMPDLMGGEKVKYDRPHPWYGLFVDPEGQTFPKGNEHQLYATDETCRWLDSKGVLYDVVGSSKEDLAKKEEIKIQKVSGCDHANLKFKMGSAWCNSCDEMIYIKDIR